MSRALSPKMFYLKLVRLHDDNSTENIDDLVQISALKLSQYVNGGRFLSISLLQFFHWLNREMNNTYFSRLFWGFNKVIHASI